MSDVDIPSAINRRLRLLRQYDEERRSQDSILASVTNALNDMSSVATDCVSIPLLDLLFHLNRLGLSEDEKIKSLLDSLLDYHPRIAKAFELIGEQQKLLVELRRARDKLARLYLIQDSRDCRRGLFSD